MVFSKFHLSKYFWRYRVAHQKRQKCVGNYDANDVIAMATYFFFLDVFTSSDLIAISSQLAISAINPLSPELFMPRTNKRSKHLQQARATKKAKLSQSSRSDDGDSSLPDLNVSTETDASLSDTSLSDTDPSEDTDRSTASGQAHDESTTHRSKYQRVILSLYSHFFFRTNDKNSISVVYQQ